jgi:hypothetical protein
MADAPLTDDLFYELINEINRFLGVGNGGDGPGSMAKNDNEIKSIGGWGDKSLFYIGPM